MTTCHVSSHRFGYLLPAIPSEWTRAPEVVDKTMLWDMPTQQAWWEMHDGVAPGLVETTERLDLCLAARDKSKRFVYVKPNLSPAQCPGHFDAVNDVNGLLLTCSPWSYYEPYDYIVYNKRALRRDHACKNFVVFLGGLDGEYAHNRRADVMSAVDEYGALLVAGHDFTTDQYIDILVKTKWMLQPHGIWPRHSTYEAMCMGVPSLIPASSYWKNFMRECCVEYESGQVPTLDELADIDWTLKRETCIDLWEKHMTTKAIVKSVMKELT